MEIIQYLTNFYNHYEEDQRLTQKHGAVEFFTTMHYIEKYIKQAMIYPEVMGSDHCPVGLEIEEDKI